jgi:hypothetical protein
MDEDTDDQPSRRQSWRQGPDPVPPGHEWLALGDDDLLFRIASLAADHTADDALLAVIRSDRHFFVRQEAAKRVRNPSMLREHWDDRHVGQILVRGLNRKEDVAYLRRLVADSRHLDVRNAAQAQLNLIARNTKAEGG